MSTASTLSFVDASGGALAALAAGVARSLGRADASAATTSSCATVPDEIGSVLAEVGASLPSVARVDAASPGQRIDVSSWGLVLFEGNGQLERLALARIARDTITRRLELDLHAPK
jgi:hypothetical protein